MDIFSPITQYLHVLKHHTVPPLICTILCFYVSVFKLIKNVTSKESREVQRKVGERKEGRPGTHQLPTTCAVKPSALCNFWFHLRPLIYLFCMN
jgi:hypothetical protein